MTNWKPISEYERPDPEKGEETGDTVLLYGKYRHEHPSCQGEYRVAYLWCDPDDHTFAWCSVDETWSSVDENLDDWVPSHFAPFEYCEADCPPATE
jgi:hypothetical protein